GRGRRLKSLRCVKKRSLLILGARSLSANQEPDAVPTDRSLAAWEIVSVSASILIAEWILSAAGGRSRLIVAIPIALAFILIVSSLLLRGESARDLGFRFDTFGRAIKLLLLPMAAITVLSFLIGFLSGTRPDLFRWHAERLIVVQLALGFAWGFLQQYV